ncbi:uncharacterized protein L3040_007897 [Drepanopeziza brunnea f. sp. 'multigermtubi']|uniref:F-box domain-containing protein n=1 Tax=Marssonina brunnea f. sp. multigermtubi (strain MB_m1) TaxID=1072389 RepID=K1WP50_MARBU|nr:uncharacterized protein MBM_07779 [Drepanopeziza brunnea f. sp. 'multigermtubi' MB_m1]EKD14102.1 hypothetical protein MBM_07779 [Drepanopeziza brunnea f. sp. 'multigermtubi' MB_m1]KAJ5035429.1 hypothetical protein L3040_007897 [Drepanopeziza brunnea f. sp. 'multigermtubi']
MATKKAQKALPAKPTKGKAPIKKSPPQTTAHKAPKRRRAASPKPKEPIPIWDVGLSSQAARERKRFRLSRTSLHDDLDEDHIAQQASLLMGESKNSWGVPERSPIEASRRPRQKGRSIRRLRGGGVADAETAYLAMFEDMQAERAPPRRPNCPSRSPILRIPLEVREEIYAYLLIYPSPIQVMADWTTLERNPSASAVDHSLLLVSRQFGAEATSFIYRNNTFQSLIRKPATAVLPRFGTPMTLPTSFHSLLRKIEIDCTKACWDMAWHERAAKGLDRLVTAGAVINTMTVMLVPQRVGMSSTALEDEASPVTFADFLWYPGPFMRAVCRLAPKKLVVVVKKTSKKRLGMELDLTYLRVGTVEDNLMANEETLKIRKARSGTLKKELVGFKDRFEEIFEDDECAVREGKCWLISTGNGGIMGGGTL